MIEFFSALARWLQLTANLVLFGSCVFLTLIWFGKKLPQLGWVRKLEQSFPWLVGIVLLGLIGILASTAGQATGDAINTWDLNAWWEILLRTRVGHLWVARFGLALLLLFIVLHLKRMHRVRWHYGVLAVTAALPLTVGSLVSHAGAEEISFASVTPYTLHILLAGVWFGALPAIIYIIRDALNNSQAGTLLLHADFLKQFSALALPVMILLFLTGWMAADRMIGDYYHTLVSSRYGWLLNLKLLILGIILWIAYRIRSVWLPLFIQENVRAGVAIGQLRKWVGIEFLLALILVLVATLLANTLPGKHAIIDHWPYPFRLSIDATWDESGVQNFFWAGTLLFILAIGIAAMGTLNRWNQSKRVILPVIMGLVSLGIALPPLIIEAYPETYQKTPIPFDAISISKGATLFAEHCVSCHGPQGKGTGTAPELFVADPETGEFPPDPTDLLTKTHTARHTVGNFYHWLSYGVEGTSMPGFSAVLTDENRWDVVNYLHALSRGYMGRLLGSLVTPNQPFLAPPVFSYFAHDGSGGSLKDFREKSNVLLVLFSWPQSQQRLFQLSDIYEMLKNDFHTEILLIPNRALTEEEMAAVTRIVPFPVITEGWSEIRDSYLLFRRTMAVPDLLRKGMTPEHIEYMIDRFGYLRARWVSQFDGFGWLITGVLTKQLTILNQEEKIKPPPDDHVH
ncbi:MAG: c-type cytochrome [Nitrosomonas sp.]|nr:MAG: c-type cytochrome [Nitrosomonas sp.]